jgi:hypothetical protein
VPSIEHATHDLNMQKDCQSDANPITGVLTQPEHHANNTTAMGYDPFVVNTAMAGSPMIASGIRNMPSTFTIAVSDFYRFNHGSLSMSKGSEP